MNINDRMEANAIIERMTAEDGEHFDHRDGERLIELIPLDRNAPNFTTKFSLTKQSSDAAEGYAAGVGNVSMSDEEKEERVDKVLIGGEKVWKVGGYEVEHRPGRVTLRKMWARNDVFGAEQEAVLDYRSSPMVLKVRQDRTFGIPNFLEIGYAAYPKWKTAR